MQEIYQKIASLGQQYGAQRIVLFGSRARGDNRRESDIDLAVYGMPEGNHTDFRLNLEELPTLLKFDVVYISPQTSPELVSNIHKDGVDIYVRQ